MTDVHLIDLDRLVRPISPERPAGDDISYSDLYDQIREARQSDDPSLAAGAWERELKTADWGRVEGLAVEALSGQSKDLQVACWLAEALAQQHGFAGVHDGLVLLRELLSRYWDDLYPENDDDLEPRANCLAWLYGILSRRVRAAALTSDGRAWFDYQDALDVDNAGARDRNLKAALVAEGKIDSETWRKLVAATPSEDFAHNQQALLACEKLCQGLDSVVDGTFGREGPSLHHLRLAIRDVLHLVGGIAKERGVAMAPMPETTTDEALPEAEPAPAAAGPAIMPEADRLPPAVAGPIDGPPQSREDALRRLREISGFFRQTEPHSPVAYLLERAVKWANMPLDLWLQEVVKDPKVLGVLNETLGVEQDEQ